MQLPASFAASWESTLIDVGDQRRAQMIAENGTEAVRIAFGLAADAPKAKVKCRGDVGLQFVPRVLLLMSVLSMLAVRSAVLVSCPGLLAFLLHGSLRPRFRTLFNAALTMFTLAVTAGARAAERSAVRHFAALCRDAFAVDGHGAAVGRTVKKWWSALDAPAGTRGCGELRRRFPDHWELTGDAPLGQGSVGDVELARPVGGGAPCAVKVISKIHCARDAAIHEAEIMRPLRHPAVCRLVDTCEDSRNVYLVLEHIDGHELFEEIESISGSANEVRAAQIMRQATAVLRAQREGASMAGSAHGTRLAAASGLRSGAAASRVAGRGRSVNARRRYGSGSSSPSARRRKSGRQGPAFLGACGGPGALDPGWMAAAASGG
ncbi:unnamed protein product [Prorocentrum cordatum]|uniref:non-specific serine/threonine protein kinase n=1 Tax=Prorocentrum cordatum TaxID=2364126 RepID=A0ABN9SZP8_9DINO|nr:unnamed protein product [Polarella glacialis]